MRLGQSELSCADLSAWPLIREHKGMLDKLLPELSSGAYDHVQDLERLMKHVAPCCDKLKNCSSNDFLTLNARS